MGKNSIEPGWQRFLDRLKQLWGKLRGGDVPQTTVNSTLSHDHP
jgi:hypothetical protein